MTRRACGWLVVLVFLVLCPDQSLAHEFRPARLSLRADASGEVDVRFFPPPVTAEGPTAASLRPRPPAHCQARAPSRWSCGEAGLTGIVRMEGLGRSPVDVLVDVRWPDGGALHDRLGPDRPALALGRGVPAAGGIERATVYFVLGGEHILAGLDHLMFLLALLLLGGRGRQHLATITAFTAGHSATLVIQSSYPLAVPGPWVEACISASIVVAAIEVLRPGPPRQAAWSWALGFGLLHGLGFAGALAELGLPPGHRLSALLAFNLGVEAGQLAVVFGLLALAAALPRGRGVDERGSIGRGGNKRGSIGRGVIEHGLAEHGLIERGRRGLAWALGSIAAAWTLERVVGFWGGA